MGKGFCGISLLEDKGGFVWKLFNLEQLQTQIPGFVLQGHTTEHYKDDVYCWPYLKILICILFKMLLILLQKQAIQVQSTCCHLFLQISHSVLQLFDQQQKQSLVVAWTYPEKPSLTTVAWDSCDTLFAVMCNPFNLQRVRVFV